jgi:hypothetical protein
MGGLAEYLPRFYTNYLKCLDKILIPEKQRRWYVIHVERFISALNGRKLKTLTSQEIELYFDTLDRQNRLSGWQYHGKFVLT